MWPFGPSRLRGDLDERLLAYVREELPARLGLPAALRAEPVIRPFAQGRRSTLRYVALDGHPPIVLRALKQGDDAHQQVNALLVGCGIPIPRLLFVDGTRATRRRYGFCALGEEHLDGQVVAEMPVEGRADALIATADILASLHSIRSPRPGKPWMKKYWAIEEWAPRRCSRLLERAALLASGPDAARRRALTAWFTERMLACRPEAYPLVHGDLNAGNILVTPDAGAYLLDPSWVAYSFAQFDLAIAEYWMAEYAPERTSEFIGRYFEASGESPALTRDAYAASRDVFAAWMFLRMTASRARGAARLRDKRDPAWESCDQAARDRWAQTERLLQAAGAP
ncbi:phosphotransferase [bacterium]|nr:phosphotransferase [bacterium]